MPTTALLRSLGDTLRRTPVDWVIWAFDADGVFLVHEGPGVRLKGVLPGESVGRSVWELHRDDAAVLDYVHRVLREPAAADLVFNDHRFHISGMPVPGGGALGFGLAPGPAADRVLPESDPRCTVAELTRPVPEIGAGDGDLLVWNPERPRAVGLYRELSLEALPAAVLRELQGVTSGSAPGAASAGTAATPGGTSRPLRERAAHLRLVP